LLPPYGENDAPASIPEPAVELDKIGVERWQYDLWYQIILATMEGHPDTIDLDYHPALSNPAASRYGATTPTLLKWFKRHNEGKARDEQVWPFNFMLAYQVSPHRFAMVSQPGFSEPGKLRKAVLSVPRPVSPYDTDVMRAAKNCFDRETGELVSIDLLMTYREALAHYHLHPEAKFLNGEPYDRGPTCRRHVEVIAINCIGKEANRWEEQYYLGLNLDAQIEYGMSPQDQEQLRKALRSIVGTISYREIAKRAAISRTTLAKIFQGQPVRHANLLIRRMLNAIREAQRERREDARLRTMRPKEQWLDRIGGFRADESPAQLRDRIGEIGRLEKLFVSGLLTFDEIEQTQRRLCELKGIYFHGEGPLDD
jgi:hypothetical protein